MSSRRAIPTKMGIAAMAAALFAGACRPRASGDAAYLASIEQWRAGRLARLTKPDGWLSLAGLSWLHPGENTVGSDPASAVPLPASAPARAGAIVLEGRNTRWVPASGAVFEVEGKPAGEVPLVSDEKGDPTVLRGGSVSFFVIQRGDRTGVRVRDSESPVRKAFKGLEHYPISSDWRFDARFVPFDPPKHISVPTILGYPEDDVAPGEIEFSWKGKSYRLVAVLEQGSDELFIVFGDRTNGKATYGGGRFLYAPMPKDGRTVLDFNKAYNPPCVFTPHATCPLPPAPNHLPFEARAGEKMYAESWEKAPR